MKKVKTEEGDEGKEKIEGVRERGGRERKKEERGSKREREERGER